MIKKRFTWKSEKLQHLNDEILLVVDNENKEWKGHILNVVDLLNQLHQENEHLIIGNKNLMKKNKQLQKKNKFLEEDVDDYHNALFDLHEKYDKLEKENEKLQNELNDCDFILCQDDFGNYEIRYDDDKIFHFLWEVAPILNKQQAIIQSLKEEVNKLNEELHYCEKFRYQVFQRLNELNED